MLSFHYKPSSLFMCHIHTEHGKSLFSTTSFDSLLSLFIFCSAIQHYVGYLLLPHCFSCCEYLIFQAFFSHYASQKFWLSLYECKLVFKENPVFTFNQQQFHSRLVYYFPPHYKLNIPVTIWVIYYQSNTSFLLLPSHLIDSTNICTNHVECRRQQTV